MTRKFETFLRGRAFLFTNQGNDAFRVHLNPDLTSREELSL